MERNSSVVADVGQFTDKAVTHVRITWTSERFSLWNPVRGHILDME